MTTRDLIVIGSLLSVLATVFAALILTAADATADLLRAVGGSL